MTRRTYTTNTGCPLPKAIFSPLLVARFWSKVSMVGHKGCWVWTAGKNNHGYGYFQPSHRGNVRAHRYAYTMLEGSIPPGHVLDHLCENPACVNPAHLEPVTPSENTQRTVDRARGIRREDL